MKLSEAYQLAMNLMKQHGLLELGWRLQFDNAKRRFGVCKYRSKTIGLSLNLTLLNDEKRVKNTILHEIAHALVGHSHGHDYVWQMKAREIGCDGERCYNSFEVVKPKGNYEAVCPCCGHVHSRFKAPKIGRKSSCGACGNGRYDEKKLLVWKKVA